MSRPINVRMCDHPDCPGWKDCPLTRTGKRTAGLHDHAPPGASDAKMLAYLGQELYLNKVSTIDGTEYWMPDGLTFIAHKEERADADGFRWVAVLEGPGADLDAILVGAPPFDPARSQDRLAALNA